MAQTIKPNKWKSHSNLVHSKKPLRRQSSRGERRSLRQYQGDDMETFAAELVKFRHQRLSWYW